jgi:hypothetical protein
VPARFQEHEFRARQTYGDIKDANLLDWPLTLAELEPFYARAEDKMGVTRTNDIPGPPGNNNFQVMYNGARKLGYKKCSTGHMAINSRVAHDLLMHATGFCFQGCKMGAKWSMLDTEIPAAEATGKPRAPYAGARSEDRARCQGTRDWSGLRGCAGRLQRQKARLVALQAMPSKRPACC